MKKLALASAVTLALAFPAFAQSGGGAGGAGGSGGALDSTPGVTGSIADRPTQAQVTQIREFWIRERPPASAVPTGVNVSTGDTLPPSVELRPFPNDLGMTQYRYVVVGENLYLVNPANRQVVHIIQ